IAAFPVGATIDHSTFTGNTAGQGGAIEGRRLVISDSTLISNSSTTEGGAIVAGGSLTLTNVTLIGNSASGRGGAIATFADQLTVLTSTLSANTARTCGGAISRINLHSFGDTGRGQLTNSMLSSNSAANGGGICAEWPLTLTNDTLLSNTAASQGGALYVYTNTIGIIDNS